MENLGWIKLHRKLLEWEWYDDSNTLRLFIHCLLKSNHEENIWRGIKINCGEFITSREKLSNELKLSQQQIRTSLNRLKSTNEITIKTTTQYTVIQINKYIDYQQTNQQDNQRATNEQPTSNQRITTNKNDKNDKNEKKKKNIFIIPLISEIEKYFFENGYTKESANKFFNYYDIANWSDSKGNKIKNWKQKAQAVWFKDENKIVKIPTNKMVY